MESGNATHAVAYDSFCFHTNKGGVGKTTLCFHTMAVYAAANPQTLVVAVDCDTQANLSATMLTQLGTYHNKASIKKRRQSGEHVPPEYEGFTEGAEVVKNMENAEVGPGAWSKTIGGLLHAEIQNQAGMAIPGDFLIDVHKHNDNLPTNIRLLCGDTRCEVLIPEVQKHTIGVATPFHNPYKKTMSILKTFCEAIPKMAEVGPTGDYQSVTLFFDTNPALNFLTQLALCASHKLIVPLNADGFSKQGVENMFHSIYGMHPIDGPLAAYEAEMFHAKVRHHQMPIAKMHAFINNKSMMFAGEATGVFCALQGKISDMLYEEYKKAMDNGDVNTVFNAPAEPNDLRNGDKFKKYFTGTMRDMMSCGAASLHSGLPLWLLKRKKHNIKHELGSRSNVDSSATSSMKDIAGSERGAYAHTCLMSLLLRPDHISKRELTLNGSGLTESQRTHLWSEFNQGPVPNT